MKLQLLSADLNSTLESQSQELVQSMPKSDESSHSSDSSDSRSPIHLFTLSFHVETFDYDILFLIHGCMVLMCCVTNILYVCVYIRALREIGFIHRESSGLRSNLSDILKDMATIEHVKPSATAVAVTPALATQTPTPVAATPNSIIHQSSQPSASNASAATTIEFLQSIDVVKTRIIRCASTLEELDRWAKRERAVEDMFDRIGGQSDISSGGIVLSSVNESTFVDLAKLHTEIQHMRSIVEKFRSLGVTASEYEARAASLKLHTTRLEKLAEALMEHTMESMLADKDSVQHEAASPTVVRHLQTLRQVYGESKAAQFQLAYQTGRIKPGLAKNIIEKFSMKSGATAANHTAASVYEPKKLDEWLSSFYTEVVHFTQSEIEFAHAVFDQNELSITTASSSSSSSSDASESKKDDSLIIHTTATATGSEVFNFSSSSSKAKPCSPSAFVYRALLASLHAELIPLLSVWLNAYITAHKTSDTTQKLVPLWQMTVQLLGFDVARVISTAELNESGESVTDEVQRAEQTLLVEMLSSPYSRYLADFGVLERRALLATLDSMSFGGDSYESTASNLSAAHTLVVQAGEAAMDRCVALSQGILIEPLVSALSEYYTELVQRLFSLLRRLRRIAGLDGLPAATSSSSANKKADGADAAVEAAVAAESQFLSFQGGFSLLRVARAIQADLFGLSGEEKLLSKVAGGELIRIVRHAQEEVEEHQRKNIGTTPRAATPLHSFQSSADIARLVFVTSLATHPDKLTSLIHFLSNHYAPFLQVTSPSSSSSSIHASSSNDATTKGFPIHHSSITSPTTTTSTTSISTSTSIHTVTSPGGTRGKFAINSKDNTSLSSLTSTSSSSSSSQLFSSASTLFESFISALHNLILDTMFKPIQSKLSSFHEWNHIWAAKSSQGLLSSIPLPNFSLQPSEYMIQIGEHLLTLVQQLEPYVSKQDDDDHHDADDANQQNDHTHDASSSSVYLEHDALYWLNLLSKGTFKHLISSIHQIPLVSERGGRQLACDLEYLVNVLQALGLTIPPTILKLQVWLTWNESQMSSKLNDGRAGDECMLSELSNEEKTMLKQVCKCRRFKNIQTDQNIQAQLNH